MEKLWWGGGGGELGRGMVVLEGGGGVVGREEVWVKRRWLHGQYGVVCRLYARVDK